MQAEIRLKRWIAQHCHNIEITSFSQAASNGAVLAALLESHIPPLALSLRNIVLTPQNEDERYFLIITASPSMTCIRRHNALIIVESLRKIRFQFNINCDDLMDPTDTFALLLFHQLYLILPQTSSCVSRVELKGNTGSEILGELQLCNLQNESVVYYFFNLDPTSKFQICKSASGL